jgi:ABC-2 type transport system permease protein
MQRASTLLWALSDSLAMIGRSTRHAVRNVDVLITTTVLPVMLLLLFVYVLGGAMNTGTVAYVNYVAPGILLLCIGYCASTTAVSVNHDMTTGIIDRFRSMPIAQSAVLTGHVMASLLRNALATTLVLLVALLVGFRPNAGWLEWLAIVGILALYTLAMSWLSAVFGLLANSAEGASAFSFVALFLPYLSSAFVPTATMPAMLRAFAEHQPYTPISNALRSLLLGLPAGDSALIAVLWWLGILVVAYLVAVHLYERKTTA